MEKKKVVRKKSLPTEKKQKKREGREGRREVKRKKEEGKREPERCSQGENFILFFFLSPWFSFLLQATSCSPPPLAKLSIEESMRGRV